MNPDKCPYPDTLATTRAIPIIPLPLARILGRDVAALARSSGFLNPGPDSGVFVLEVARIYDARPLLGSRRQDWPETLQARAADGTVFFYFLWPCRSRMRAACRHFAPGMSVHGEGDRILLPRSTLVFSEYTWVNPIETTIENPPTWIQRSIFEDSEKRHGDLLPPTSLVPRGRVP